MNEGILRRIERRTGLPGLVELLAERLSPGDLQSLLLEVYAQKASKLSEVDLLQRRQQSRFCQNAPVSPGALLELKQLWLRLLDGGFEALEISPLAPLGSCSVLAPVHQNKLVTCIRNLEVAADPSNQLALECALRRSEGQPEVHLSACQRVVRAQALPGPECFAHFSLLALASASGDPEGFEELQLRRHLSFHLRFLRQALPGEPLTLRWSPRTPRALVSRVEGWLRERGFEFDSGWLESAESSNYYLGVRFKLWAGSAEVGDGGATNWSRRLLKSRRERLLISGLGLERIALKREKKEAPRRGG